MEPPANQVSRGGSGMSDGEIVKEFLIESHAKLDWFDCERFELEQYGACPGSGLFGPELWLCSALLHFVISEC